VKDILKNDGFLVSMLSMIEPEDKIKNWNIGFYDPKNKKITEIHVSDEGVKVEKPDQPLREITNNPDENKIKISPEEALKIAKGELEKYDSSAKKIIISFQFKEKEIWNVTFISKMGTLINIEIDVTNGEILNSDKKSLFQKGSSVAG